MGATISQARIAYAYDPGQPDGPKARPAERCFEVSINGSPPVVVSHPAANTPTAVAAYLDALNGLAEWALKD